MRSSTDCGRCGLSRDRGRRHGGNQTNLSETALRYLREASVRYVMVYGGECWVVKIVLVNMLIATFAVPVGVCAAIVPQGLSPCRASNLTAAAAWGGIANSETGNIRFTNNGAKACTMRGRLGVMIIDGRGHALSVVESYYPNYDPFVSRGLPTDDRRRGVVRPGLRAFVAVVWRNWCGGEAREPFTLLIALPQGGHVQARVNDESGIPLGYPAHTPYCRNRRQPSVIGVGMIALASPSAYLP